MGLFDKIFGTYSERELKRIEPIKNQVLALEDKYKQYTDSQLRAETDRFKSEPARPSTTSCPKHLPSAARQEPEF